MSRSTRQSKILSLISSKDIETQEELAQLLSDAGFVVTQATVSRDIKEMGLVKTLSNGKYKYSTKQKIDNTLSSKLLNVVREATLSAVVAGNLVVVKTISDGATVVSSAIEQLVSGEVLGVVADRATILVVCESNDVACDVLEKINQLL